MCSLAATGSNTLPCFLWLERDGFRFAAPLNQSPFVPASELVKVLQLSLARNYPRSSPRRRGPIATELSISRRLHIAMTRRMGPRLRGDDRGRFIASHILPRGRAELRCDSSLS